MPPCSAPVSYTHLDVYKRQPYVLLDGGTVVASIAVNRMQTMWRGKGRSYIQLGTVMTDPQYRKQGLSRCLMEQVLRDYCRSCDAVYLFANDSALDFYPRFGFERAVEYQFICPVTPNPEAAQRLDTVSYTHLDVYKRQRAHNMKIGCGPD